MPCAMVINRRYCSHKIFFVLDSGTNLLYCGGGLIFNTSENLHLKNYVFARIITSS